MNSREVENMAAKAEGERHVVLLSGDSGVQKERWRMIDERKVRPILGSDVYYHPEDGSIYYVIWGDVKFQDKIPETLALRRPLPPSADILAPYTRYTEWKRGSVHKTDNIQTAIRAFNHILNNIRQREVGQTSALKQRALDLLDYFATLPFDGVSEQEFALARDKTYAVLASVKLNPDNLRNSEKIKIVGWLLRGEKDSLGRWNKLIRISTLQAAVRHVMEHERGLTTEVQSKYLRGREALVLENNFSSSIFREIIERVAPEAMPATIGFTRPWPKVPQLQKGVVIGLLGTMEHQLDRFIRVNPYKQVAKKAALLFGNAKDLYQQGERERITNELFPEIRALLPKAL